MKLKRRIGTKFFMFVSSLYAHPIPVLVTIYVASSIKTLTTTRLANNELSRNTRH